MTASRSALPVVASIVVAAIIAAIVIAALVLRYTGPTGATRAADACVDQASPASTFTAQESFSVDAVITGPRVGLEGWPLVATKLESQYNVDDAVETFWVIGTVDATEAVCVVDFTDGAMVSEPQFIDFVAFAPFR